MFISYHHPFVFGLQQLVKVRILFLVSVWFSHHYSWFKKRQKSGRCVSKRVAGVWQLVVSAWQCGNVRGVCVCVREGGRCVAVGRFCVAVVPRLCVSQCGRCVVSAWQLGVSRQVCPTIGPVKIMVEKPPKSSLSSITLLLYFLHRRVASRVSLCFFVCCI